MYDPILSNILGIPMASEEEELERRRRRRAEMESLGLLVPSDEFTGPQSEANAYLTNDIPQTGMPPTFPRPVMPPTSPRSVMPPPVTQPTPTQPAPPLGIVGDTSKLPSVDLFGRPVTPRQPASPAEQLPSVDLFGRPLPVQPKTQVPPGAEGIIGPKPPTPTQPIGSILGAKTPSAAKTPPPASAPKDGVLTLSNGVTLNPLGKNRFKGSDNKTYRQQGNSFVDEQELLAPKQITDNKKNVYKRVGDGPQGTKGIYSFNNQRFVLTGKNSIVPEIEFKAQEAANPELYRASLKPISIDVRQLTGKAPNMLAFADAQKVKNRIRQDLEKQGVIVSDKQADMIMSMGMSPNGILTISPDGLAGFKGRQIAKSVRYQPVLERLYAQGANLKDLDEESLGEVGMSQAKIDEWLKSPVAAGLAQTRQQNVNAIAGLKNNYAKQFNAARNAPVVEPKFAPTNELMPSGAPKKRLVFSDNPMEALSVFRGMDKKIQDQAMEAIAQADKGFIDKGQRDERLLELRTLGRTRQQLAKVIPAWRAANDGATAWVKSFWKEREHQESNWTDEQLLDGENEVFLQYAATKAAQFGSLDEWIKKTEGAKRDWAEKGTLRRAADHLAIGGIELSALAVDMVEGAMTLSEFLNPITQVAGRLGPGALRGLGVTPETVGAIERYTSSANLIHEALGQSIGQKIRDNDYYKKYHEYGDDWSWVTIGANIAAFLIPQATAAKLTASAGWSAKAMQTTSRLVSWGTGTSMMIPGQYTALRKAGYSDREAKDIAVAISVPLGATEMFGIGGIVPRYLKRLSAAEEMGSKVMTDLAMDIVRNGGQKSIVGRLFKASPYHFGKEFTEETIQETLQSATEGSLMKMLTQADPETGELREGWAALLFAFGEFPDELVDSVPHAMAGGVFGGGLGLTMGTYQDYQVASQGHMAALQKQFQTWARTKAKYGNPIGDDGQEIELSEQDRQELDLIYRQAQMPVWDKYAKAMGLMRRVKSAPATEREALIREATALIDQANAARVFFEQRQANANIQQRRAAGEESVQAVTDEDFVITQGGIVATIDGLGRVEEVRDDGTAVVMLRADLDGKGQTRLYDVQELAPTQPSETIIRVRAQEDAQYTGRGVELLDERINQVETELSLISEPDENGALSPMDGQEDNFLRLSDELEELKTQKDLTQRIRRPIQSILQDEFEAALEAGAFTRKESRARSAAYRRLEAATNGRIVESKAGGAFTVRGIRQDKLNRSYYVVEEPTGDEIGGENALYFADAVWPEGSDALPQEQLDAMGEAMDNAFTLADAVEAPLSPRVTYEAGTPVNTPRGPAVILQDNGDEVIVGFERTGKLKGLQTMPYSRSQVTIAQDPTEVEQDREYFASPAEKQALVEQDIQAAIQDEFGFTPEEAALIFEEYDRMGEWQINPQTGQWTLKTPALWNQQLMQKALEKAQARVAPAVDRGENLDQEIDILTGEETQEAEVAPEEAQPAEEGTYYDEDAIEIARQVGIELPWDQLLADRMQNGKVKQKFRLQVKVGKDGSLVIQFLRANVDSGSGKVSDWSPLPVSSQQAMISDILAVLEANGQWQPKDADLHQDSVEFIEGEQGKNGVNVLRVAFNPVTNTVAIEVRGAMGADQTFIYVPSSDQDAGLDQEIDILTGEESAQTQPAPQAPAVEQAEGTEQDPLDTLEAGADALRGVVNKVPPTHLGKQIKTLLNTLIKTDKPVAALDAISKLEEFLDPKQAERMNMTPEEWAAFTAEIQAGIDQIQSALAQMGYEIVPETMRGQAYTEDTKAVVEYKNDPNVPEGEEVITKVKKPAITKDGQLIQGAEIVVSIGGKKQAGDQVKDSRPFKVNEAGVVTQGLTTITIPLPAEAKSTIKVTIGQNPETGKWHVGYDITMEAGKNEYSSDSSPATLSEAYDTREAALAAAAEDIADVVKGWMRSPAAKLPKFAGAFQALRNGLDKWYAGLQPADVSEETKGEQDKERRSYVPQEELELPLPADLKDARGQTRTMRILLAQDETTGSWHSVLDDDVTEPRLDNEVSHKTREQAIAEAVEEARGAIISEFRESPLQDEALDALEAWAESVLPPAKTRPKAISKQTEAGTFADYEQAKKAYEELGYKKAAEQATTVQDVDWLRQAWNEKVKSLGYSRSYSGLVKTGRPKDGDTILGHMYLSFIDEGGMVEAMKALRQEAKDKDIVGQDIVDAFQEELDAREAIKKITSGVVSDPRTGAVIDGADKISVKLPKTASTKVDVFIAFDARTGKWFYEFDLTGLDEDGQPEYLQYLNGNLVTFPAPEHSDRRSDMQRQASSEGYDSYDEARKAGIADALDDLDRFEDITAEELAKILEDNILTEQKQPGVNAFANYEQAKKAYDELGYEQARIQAATTQDIDWLRQAELEEARRRTPEAKKEALIEQARKYDTFEEFRRAVFDQAPEYGMSHRPSWEGMPPASNLLEGDAIPRDVYEHPEWSIASGRDIKTDKAARESWQALQKMRGKPDRMVEVFRAGAKNELNIGDWITFSREYAEMSREGDEQVNSFMIPASDAIFAGDDINEFGYFPTSLLREAWDAVQAETKAAPQTLAEQKQEETQPIETVTEEAQGKTQTVYAGDIKTQIDKRAISADQLITSDEAGYPAELQPRDTTRKASAAFVSSIAADLDTDRLGDDNFAGNGRPIVVPVMVNGELRYAVIAGNHRVGAIRQRYNRGDNQEYADFAAQSAPETAEGVDNPVYVGVITNPDKIDLQAFARAANAPQQRTMSVAEQAVQDAKGLSADILAKLVVSEQGDLGTTANGRFIQDFLRMVGEERASAYRTATGGLSQDGLRAMRAAIFAAAYADTQEGLALLEQVFESEDSNIKRITAAMLVNAAAFAQLKADIAKGNRFDGLDISTDLAAMAVKFADLRNQDMPVSEFLQQGSLFGAETTPLQALILQTLEKNKNSAKALNAILQNYLGAVDALGSPNQMSMFGNAENRGAISILQGVIEDHEGNKETNQQALFGTEFGPQDSQADQGAAETEEAGPAEETDVKITIPRPKGVRGDIRIYADKDEKTGKWKAAWAYYLGKDSLKRKGGGTEAKYETKEDALGVAARKLQDLMRRFDRENTKAIVALNEWIADNAAAGVLASAKRVDEIQRQEWREDLEERQKAERGEGFELPVRKLYRQSSRAEQESIDADFDYLRPEGMARLARYIAEFPGFATALSEAGQQGKPSVKSLPFIQQLHADYAGEAAAYLAEQTGETTETADTQQKTVTSDELKDRKHPFDPNYNSTIRNIARNFATPQLQEWWNRKGARAIEKDGWVLDLDARTLSRPGSVTILLDPQGVLGTAGLYRQAIITLLVKDLSGLGPSTQQEVIDSDELSDRVWPNNPSYNEGIRKMVETQTEAELKEWWDAIEKDGYRFDLAARTLITPTGAVILLDKQASLSTKELYQKLIVTFLTKDKRGIGKNTQQEVNENNLNDAVDTLEESEINTLEEVYGEERGSEGFMAKLRDDLVAFAEKGAKGVRVKLRKIIAKVAAAVLAVGMILTNTGIGQATKVQIPVPTDTTVQTVYTETKADFGDVIPSIAVATVAKWSLETNQTKGKPSIIVDKANATAYVLDAKGKLVAASPVVTGLQKDRDSFRPGELEGITGVEGFTPDKRITAAGRSDITVKPVVADIDEGMYRPAFVAAYAMPGAVVQGATDAVHPTYTKARAEMVASAGQEDNFASYGCVNTGVDFFKNVIEPLFIKGKPVGARTGTIFVLPAVEPLEKYFPEAVAGDYTPTQIAEYIVVNAEGRAETMEGGIAVRDMTADRRTLPISRQTGRPIKDSGKYEFQMADLRNLQEQGELERGERAVVLPPTGQEPEEDKPLTATTEAPQTVKGPALLEALTQQAPEDADVREGEKGKPLAKSAVPSSIPANLALIDRALDINSNPEQSEDAWARYWAYLTKNRTVPIAPFNLIAQLRKKVPFGDMLKRLTPGQIKDADAGIAGAKRFRKLYVSGVATPTTTAKLALWGLLSRGVSPYVQESMFLFVANKIDPWIASAEQGKFNLDKYTAWVKSLKFEKGLPANGAKHSLNAFGENFLANMSKEVEPGKSGLTVLHEWIADKRLTGPEIRRKFHGTFKGVGFNNKVLSFMLLVTGRDDVLVLDRVQISNLFDDGRYAGQNLYDGFNHTTIKLKPKTKKGKVKTLGKLYQEEGESDADFKAAVEAFKADKAEELGVDLDRIVGSRDKTTGSSIEPITKDLWGLATYEAIERAVSRRVGAIYKAVGREKDATLGRFHWETWVAKSGQEAGHGTLEGLYREAAGEEAPYEGVFAKEGQYDTYSYGAEFGMTPAGQPFLQYTDSTGEKFVFTPAEFKTFLSEIHKAKNNIVPKGFKVSENTRSPWYENKQVNREALDTLVAKIGRPKSDGVIGKNAKKPAADGKVTRRATDKPLTALRTQEAEEKVKQLRSQPLTGAVVKEAKAALTKLGVELNIEAGAVLEAIARKTFDMKAGFEALFLQPNNVPKLLKAVKATADGMRKKGMTSAATALDEIAKVMQQGIDRGTLVLYVFDNKISHEILHKIRYLTSNGAAIVNRYNNFAELLKTSHGGVNLVETAYNNFLKVTYAGKAWNELSLSEKAVIWEEAFVESATGEFAKLGLNADQATALIRADLDAFTEKNGTQILTDIQEFIDERFREGTAEGRAEGPVQEVPAVDTGGVPGGTEGGQDGTEEGGDGKRTQSPRYAERILETGFISYDTESMSETDRRGQALRKVTTIPDLINRVKWQTGDLAAVMAALYHEQRELVERAEKYKKAGKTAEYDATLQRLAELSEDIIRAQIETGRAVNIAKMLYVLPQQQALIVASRIKKHFTGNKNAELTPAEVKAFTEAAAEVEKAEKELKEVTDRIQRKKQGRTDTGERIQRRATTRTVSEGPKGTTVTVRTRLNDRLQRGFEQNIEQVRDFLLSTDNPLTALADVTDDAVKKKLAELQQSVFRDELITPNHTFIAALAVALNARVKYEWQQTGVEGDATFYTVRAVRLSSADGAFILNFILPQQTYKNSGLNNTTLEWAWFKNAGAAGMQVRPTTRAIIRLADRYGITITGTAYALGALPQNRLESLYEALGFKPQKGVPGQGTRMTRVPNAEDKPLTALANDTYVPAEHRKAFGAVAAKLLQDGFDADLEYDADKFVEQLVEMFGARVEQFADDVVRLGFETLAQSRKDAARDALVAKLGEAKADAELNRREQERKTRAKGKNALRKLASQAKNRIGAAAEIDKLKADPVASDIAKVLLVNSNIDLPTLVDRVADEYGLDEVEAARQVFAAKDLIQGVRRNALIEKYRQKGDPAPEVSADTEIREKKEEAKERAKRNRDVKRMLQEHDRSVEQQEEIAAKTNDPVVQYIANKLLEAKRPGAEALTIASLLKDIDKEFGIGLEAARNKAREAQVVVDQIIKERAEAKALAKGLSLEDFELQRQKRVELRKKQQHFSNLLRNHNKPKTLIKKFNMFLRGTFVFNLITQFFNFLQGFSMVGVQAYTDLVSTALRLITGKAGLFPDEVAPMVNFKTAWLTYGYLLANNRQIAEGIVAQYPDEWHRLELGIIADIPIEETEDMDSKNILKLAHRHADKLPKLTEWLAKWSFAREQEIQVRTAVVMGTLDQFARNKGTTLKKAIEEHSTGALFTEAEVREAVTRALRTTFALPIEGKAGSIFRSLYDQMDNWVPVFLNPIVYLRFTYTTTKLIANGFLGGALDAKALGGRGYDSISVAQTVAAWSSVLLAAAIQESFGGDDEEWYTIYINGPDNPPIDIRRWYPMSVSFFVAHNIRLAIQGKPIMGLDEAVQAFASIEWDIYARSAGVEAIKAAYNATWNRAETPDADEKLWKANAKLLGNVLGGMLRPLSPIKRFVNAFSEEEAKLRNYKEDAASEFIGEIAKSVPGLATLYKAPELIDPVTLKPVTEQMPLARVFGFNYVHQMFTKPKLTKAEALAQRMFPSNFTTPLKDLDKIEAARVRSEIKQAVRSGKINETRAETLVDYHVSKGVLTEDQGKRLIGDLKLTYLEEIIKYRVSLGDKTHVKRIKELLRVASPRERKLIMDILEKKDLP